jgi:aspartate-semialdehyde dehydrogenase
VNRNPQIAVVGATGVVGQELLAAIAAAGHPADAITALASERSAGRELEYGEDSVAVEQATAESFRGIDLACFATPGDAAKTLAPAAQRAGAWSVDVSSAFRLDPGVPLVAPAVNAQLLSAPFRGRIVSCPSAITTALVTALEPLRSRFGVERAFATALLGVSSAGYAGLDELQQQTADLLSGREPEAARFPHRIGFNLIPQVGTFGPGAQSSSEELSWSEEFKRIWTGADAPFVQGTAIQAPTFYGHLLTVEAQLRSAASAEDVRGALRASSHLKLLDSPADRIYPMPMLVSGDPTVHVGRVREVSRSPLWFALVVGIDNGRRGAALNALEVGRALLARADSG